MTRGVSHHLPSVHEMGVSNPEKEREPSAHEKHDASVKLKRSPALKGGRDSIDRIDILYVVFCITTIHAACMYCTYIHVLVQHHSLCYIVCMYSTYVHVVLYFSPLK